MWIKIMTQASPLFDHLAQGSIITKIDDISLKGNPLEMWSKVLLPQDTSEKQILSEQDLGFCIPNKLLFGM
jgi:hypothetical protein